MFHVPFSVKIQILKVYETETSGMLFSFLLILLTGKLARPLMEGKKSSDENSQSEGKPLNGEREGNYYLHISLIYQFVKYKKYLVGSPRLDGILL